jgi:cytoskeletal protein CcmA (bactofilin family)
LRRRVSCPHCGNQDLTVLPERDHIEKFYNGPISRLQGLCGAKLYHCVYCRLQFYDARKPADPAAIQRDKLRFAKTRALREARSEAPAGIAVVGDRSPAGRARPSGSEEEPEAAKPVTGGPTPMPASKAAAISQGALVEGVVSASRDLYLDGEVEGTLELRGRNLTIGPSGKVRAHIKAMTLTLMGYSEGDVEAEGNVTICKGGSLIGDIRAADVTIEDGAYFQGRIEIVNGPSADTRKTGSAD